MIKLKIVLKIL